MRGDTPFLHAARAGDWGAMCRLRRAGASPAARNAAGETANDLVGRPALALGPKHRLAAWYVLCAPRWALAPLEPLCWDRGDAPSGQAAAAGGVGGGLWRNGAVLHATSPAARRVQLHAPFTPPPRPPPLGA